MAPVTLYVDEELFIGKRFIMRAPSSRIPNKLLVRVVEEHNGGYIVERITREEQINEILI
jgi:spore coat polysaccharide biosynthesis protein SpsF (cytidylyltransferase family)